MTPQHQQSPISGTRMSGKTAKVSREESPTFNYERQKQQESVQSNPRIRNVSLSRENLSDKQKWPKLC